jgi:formamidopyrimidine-DNA glycosylase
MPELPEVEITRRGIAPHVEGRTVTGVVVRHHGLRWPVPRTLAKHLAGANVRAVDRRAKYLLLRTDRGTALLHLGMTGSLRVITDGRAPGPWDHVDLVRDDGVRVRFTDPRRFGSIHWTTGDPAAHPLLAGLGPEPLDAGFDGGYLAAESRRRKVAIKAHIMNARVVVGVGNIYASESLYRAGIHPHRPAGRIGAPRLAALADAIKAVLAESIRAGGTTLRDFYGGDGKPGYFAQRLQVYDREGLPCPACGTPIRQMVIGQRSSYFCPRCQR